MKDFDVYSFYAGLPRRCFPNRRKVQVDYGTSKFGRWGAERRDFEGRHVDLMWRDLPVKPNANPFEAIESYLAKPRARTPRLLAGAAVVLLEPAHLRGKVAWPLSWDHPAKEEG